MRGKIIAVGYIIKEQPENWQFDCMDKIPAMEITADNRILFAGYSIAELEKISNEYWGTG